MKHVQIISRVQDNASDKFLEVIEQTDISLLLKQIPMCLHVIYQQKEL